MMSQSPPVNKLTFATDTGDFRGNKYLSLLLHPPQQEGELPQAEGLPGSRKRGFQKGEDVESKGNFTCSQFCPGWHQ